MFKIYSIAVVLNIALQSYAFGYNIFFTYDNLNRLTKADYSNGTVINYTYDSVGNRLSMVSTVPTPPSLTLDSVSSPTTLASQTISGATEADATVTVSVNGGAPQVATVTGTNWSYTITDFISGTNNIQITASKEPGNTKVIETSITCSAPKLTVSLVGTGGGIVTSSPAGIACASGSCSRLFDKDTTVNLIATPNTDSLFDGWFALCSTAGNSCDLVMDNEKALTATFSYVQPVQVQSPQVSYYSVISNAYAALSGSGTILTRQYEFVENLNLDKVVSVVIKGGYDSSYSTNSGFTTLNGSLTIRNGSLTVENLVIK